MSDQYPELGDYARAVQGRPSPFMSAPVVGLVVERSTEYPGPEVASGRVAIVFFGSLGDRGDVALKCFTVPPGQRGRRYSALQKHFSDCRSGVLVSFDWIDDAISVKGRTYPVLLMDRVQGQVLTSWIDDHIGDRGAFETVIGNWNSLLVELATLGIGHGDLQGGNVMVAGNGDLTLIDLDGVWLEALENVPPDEVGHVAFQHPTRVSRQAYHRHVDTFSALVIHISLTALARKPGLWTLKSQDGERFHNGENLLFDAPDFAASHAGVTEIWSILRTIGDADLNYMLDVLELMCRTDDACDWPFTLQNILDPSFVRSAPNAARNDTNTDTSTSGWWQDLPTTDRRLAADAHQQLVPTDSSPTTPRQGKNPDWWKDLHTDAVEASPTIATTRRRGAPIVDGYGIGASTDSATDEAVRAFGSRHGTGKGGGRKRKSHLENRIGAVYDGKVVEINRFGVFVRVSPGRDGFLHVPTVGNSGDIGALEEVFSIGDRVNVVVRAISYNGDIILASADVRVGAQPSPYNGPNSTRRSIMSNSVNKRRLTNSPDRKVVTFQDEYE